MIPHNIIAKLVSRMTADTGPKGIEKMCADVGIPFEGVKQMLTRNFGPPDGTKRCPSQLALDFMMLGAAIGYLYGKGETIHDDNLSQGSGLVV